MTDERRWIASVRDVEPPDYWDDAARSTGAVTDAEVDFLGARQPIPEEVLDVVMQIDDDLVASGADRTEHAEVRSNVVPLLRPRVDASGRPASDPVLTYLQEIAEIPRLTTAEHTDLGRRVFAGELATEIQRELAVDGWVDRRRMGRLAGSVREIREQQLAELGTLRGIGGDPIARTRMFRPGTDEELLRSLDRVERDGQLAKRTLIEANLRLVVGIAKQYVGRGMRFLDLIQEGNLGLIRAIEDFDPSKSVPFVEVASWWIRRAITTAISEQARTIRIPVLMVEKVNKLVRVERRLLQDLGREPTAEEIGTVMGIGADEVREVQELSHEPVPSETPIERGEEGRLDDFIEDSDAVVAVDEASFILLQEQLGSVLHTLSEREKKVIELRFGLADGNPRTLEEIGRAFGITRERIRKIESKTLSKLRYPSRRQRLLAEVEGRDDPVSPSAPHPAEPHEDLRHDGAEGDDQHR